MTNDDCDQFATGNAEAPQKLELTGFSSETQVWAWETFAKIAKSLSFRNEFKQDEWLEMEVLALAELLSDQAIHWDPASPLPLKSYLAGVIKQKLSHAAAKVADERSIWSSSRRSLDVACGSDEGDATLGDLVTEGASLSANQKYITKPRAIQIRNLIKTLRNKHDYAGLEALRRKLRHEDARPNTSAEESEDGETVVLTAAPETECVTRSDDTPCDTFADDAESLNRTTFSPRDHHLAAVAEMGFPEDEEAVKVQPVIRSRTPSFGRSPAESQKRRDLKLDVKDIIRTLPPRLRAWCRRVKDAEDPVETYKQLGIGKNEYYKHVLPTLRQAFADLRDSAC